MFESSLAIVIQSTFVPVVNNKKKQEQEPGRRRLLAEYTFDFNVYQDAIISSLAVGGVASENKRLASASAVLITLEPTQEPTAEPTVQPSDTPTVEPTDQPSVAPTAQPTTADPTPFPTSSPTGPYESETKACEYSLATYECPIGGVMQVIRATFGRDDRDTCSPSRDLCEKEADVTEHAKFKCDDEPSCMLYVETSELDTEDPCKGVSKFLKMSFKCIDVDTRKEKIKSNEGKTPVDKDIPFGSVCADDRLELSCDEGLIISRVRGRFGRENNPTRCVKGVQAPNCGTSDVSDFLEDRCLGADYCNVQIVPDQDFCASGYLQSGTYRCSPAVSIAK